MRSLIAITASVAMLAAQVPALPAYAESAPAVPQATAAQTAAVAAVFKAYPNGGDPLSKQVVGLIMSNPKLAPEFVIYMRNAATLNRAQKLAAEHGLAAALEQLKVKAADLGVRPLVTKDGIVAEPLEDAWFVALSILAVAAAVCIAACRENNNNNVVVIQASTH